MLFYAGIPGLVGGYLGHALVYLSSANSFLARDFLSLEDSILFALICPGIVLELGAFCSWKVGTRSKQQEFRWIP